MPAVARVGDSTIGANLGGGQSTVYCNGILVQVLGDGVAPHYPCPLVPIHCGPVHVQGSPNVFIEGKAVVRIGDAASCGHTDVSGSPDVFCNDQ